MDNTYKINGLDLFSGIGGIGLALQNYVRTVAYCEIEPYCRAVLMSRMSTGHLDYAPIWDDIRSLSGSELDIDIIFGGFPCQDISVAGAGKGLAGERSGLFFEILRLAEEVKPTFIFLENVPAITTRGGLQVVEEITSLGYDCRWCVISAASVGALHRRERWFLLAHAVNDGTSTSEKRGSVRECSSSWKKQNQQEESIRKTERTSCLSGHVANSTSPSANRFPQRKEKKYTMSSFCGDDCHTDSQSSEQFESRDDWQKTVSEMGKCTNGLPHLVDRLRALGNSVVPKQVKKAFEILMGIR